MPDIVGIFGGTFDPIHLGHRRAVDMLCEQIPFDQVRWVLSARPPHKNQVSASIEDRFAMLELCLADNPLYVADDIEINRQQESYTIDTVNAFHEHFDNASMCVIIGGDSLHSLHTWHRYTELMERTNWVVMHRPGYELEVPDVLKHRVVDSSKAFIEALNNHYTGKIWVFEASHFDVSSTALRTALSHAANSQLPKIAQEYLTSDVSDYIRAHQLYKIGANIKANKIMNSEQVKDQVVEALEGVKGQDIKVIDIADISDFADYMVVASGTSDTHVKALARSASDSLRSQGVKPLGEDGADVGEWVLVDFGDVVLHVMRPEVRDYYDLEKLWDEDVRKIVEQHREEQGD